MLIGIEFILAAFFMTFATIIVGGLSAGLRWIRVIAYSRETTDRSSHRGLVWLSVSVGFAVTTWLIADMAPKPIAWHPTARRVLILCLAATTLAAFASCFMMWRQSAPEGPWWNCNWSDAGSQRVLRLGSTIISVLDTLCAVVMIVTVYSTGYNPWS